MGKHGGKRKGAGRKPDEFPAFLKKLRATSQERAGFMSHLSGNARQDFLLILDALTSTPPSTLPARTPAAGRRRTAPADTTAAEADSR